ncbi:MAG TPA: AI-2E family transporter [bacterium]
MISSPKTRLENSEDEPKRVVRFELAPSTMIILATVFAVLWLLFKLLPVLLALIAAFFIVGTLNPAVHWLEGKRFSRGLSIAIVFGSLMVSTLVVAILTIPALLVQASAILQQEPILRGQLADRLSGHPITEALANWLRNFKYGGSVITSGPKAFAYSMQALGFVAYALGAVSLALYIMIDRDRLRGGLFSIVPRSHHIRLSRVMMNLETIVGAYIRGQLITSVAIGVFILILLVACGVENAVVLAIFGGIADILPYIGIFFPIAAVVLSAVPHGPVITIVVLALMLLYMEFESRVLVPRVYGQALRLPSTVVLFSLFAGGTLMGIAGALLALPFAAAAMMLIEELRVQLPGVQEQMADEVLREKDDRGEEEYERRTEGVSAEQSAAIAVEISGDRVKEENQTLKKVGP